MKKTILILSLLLLGVVCPVNASELTGLISTNPDVLPGNNSHNSALGSGSSGGGSTITLLKQQDSNNSGEDKTEIVQESKEDVGNAQSGQDIKVLGVSHGPFLDGTLLRASNKKIYIISGQFKKHIVSLRELRKYAGQIIYDVTDAELAKYQERKHVNGDLIREQGMDEIYIIESNRRIHVLSLKELRARYFGQEIFNISLIEMKLYQFLGE